VAVEQRGTVVVWVVAGVLATLAVLRLVGPGGDGGAAPPVRVERSPDEAGGSTGERSGGGTREGIFVHVAGAVRRPGLVRVLPGSRVAAAVERAGGPARRADLSGVNLAARLEDGQQVVVPVAGAAGAAVTPGTAAGAGVPGGVKLSLGTATVDQLDEIDGIGPTLAERIVQHRTENGGFSSLEELRDVDGIGEKRFETLREALQP
jgi:competence protein ComEA